MGDTSMMGDAPVFATYFEAHREAARRSAEVASNGLVCRVVKSPYGGFAVRTWPVELLAEPTLARLGVGDKPSYTDLL